MTTLHDINTLAADALDERGWIQGAMKNADGSMCLVGALRHCSPQPGDWLIARAVYRRLGHAENWNDTRGRTADEVTAWLREHPVTDDDLEAAFGPQWEAIVRLVRQAAKLTQEQANALWAAWDAAWNAAGLATRSAAETAARTAARTASRDADWGAAWYAAWDAVEVAAWNAAGLATRSAAAALAIADLVGQHGLTQDHIDTLLAPWVSVMGDPRDGVEVGS